MLQFFEGNGTIQIELAGLGSPQFVQMRAAAEFLSDVVCVGPDIKPLAANDSEIDNR